MADPRHPDDRANQAGPPPDPNPTIDTRCPSPTAAGRQDRCGLLSHPARCTEDDCTMADANPAAGKIDFRQTQLRVPVRLDESAPPSVDDNPAPRRPSDSTLAGLLLAFRQGRPWAPGSEYVKTWAESIINTPAPDDTEALKAMLDEPATGNPDLKRLARQPIITGASRLNMEIITPKPRPVTYTGRGRRTWCNNCGSYVRDRLAHTLFHAELTEALAKIPPLWRITIRDEEPATKPQVKITADFEPARAALQEATERARTAQARAAHAKGAANQEYNPTNWARGLSDTDLDRERKRNHNEELLAALDEEQRRRGTGLTEDELKQKVVARLTDSAARFATRYQDAVSLVIADIANQLKQKLPHVRIVTDIEWGVVLDEPDVRILVEPTHGPRRWVTGPDEIPVSVRITYPVFPADWPHNAAARFVNDLLEGGRLTNAQAWITFHSILQKDDSNTITITYSLAQRIARTEPDQTESARAEGEVAPPMRFTHDNHTVTVTPAAELPIDPLADFTTVPADDSPIKALGHQHADDPRLQYPIGSGDPRLLQTWKMDLPDPPIIPAGTPLEDAVKKIVHGEADRIEGIVTDAIGLTPAAELPRSPLGYDADLTISEPPTPSRQADPEEPVHLPNPAQFLERIPTLDLPPADRDVLETGRRMVDEATGRAVTLPHPGTVPPGTTITVDTTTGETHTGDSPHGIDPDTSHTGTDRPYRRGVLGIPGEPSPETKRDQANEHYFTSGWDAALTHAAELVNEAVVDRTKPIGRQTHNAALDLGHQSMAFVRALAAATFHDPKWRAAAADQFRRSFAEHLGIPVDDNAADCGGAPTSDEAAEPSAFSEPPCPRCHNFAELGALEAKRVKAMKVGTSSDALVRYAFGIESKPTVGGGSRCPQDRGDLGRCEFAYENAPPHIQERMLPVLKEFRAYIEARYPTTPPTRRQLVEAVDNLIAGTDMGWNVRLRPADAHHKIKGAKGRSASWMTSTGIVTTVLTANDTTITAASSTWHPFTGNDPAGHFAQTVVEEARKLTAQPATTYHLVLWSETPADAPAVTPGVAYTLVAIAPLPSAPTASNPNKDQ